MSDRKNQPTPNQPEDVDLDRTQQLEMVLGLRGLQRSIRGRSWSMDPMFKAPWPEKLTRDDLHAAHMDFELLAPEVSRASRPDARDPRRTRRARLLPRDGASRKDRSHRRRLREARRRMPLLHVVLARRIGVRLVWPRPRRRRHPAPTSTGGARHLSLDSTSSKRGEGLDAPWNASSTAGRRSSGQDRRRGLAATDSPRLEQGSKSPAANESPRPSSACLTSPTMTQLGQFLGRRSGRVPPAAPALPKLAPTRLSSTWTGEGLPSVGAWASSRRGLSPARGGRRRRSSGVCPSWCRR